MWPKKLFYEKRLITQIFFANILWWEKKLWWKGLWLKKRNEKKLDVRRRKNQELFCDETKPQIMTCVKKNLKHKKVAKLNN